MIELFDGNHFCSDDKGNLKSIAYTRSKYVHIPEESVDNNLEIMFNRC